MGTKNTTTKTTTENAAPATKPTKATASKATTTKKGKAVKVEVKKRPEGMTGKRGKLFVVGSTYGGKPIKKFKALDAERTYSAVAADGSAQLAWSGHRMVEILRWMGKNGANCAEAALWLKALTGWSVSPNTLAAQVTSGRAWEGEAGISKGYNGGFRGDVAAFTAEQKKHVLSVRPVAAE